MPITRTNIIDDDGTGQTGTPLNNTWKQELYDQIDAVASGAEQTTAATGAQHNFDLAGSNIYLRCTGAAPSFSGFTVLGAAPSPGDRVLIECLGTTAKVTNQDTNSTAAHRVITPSTTGQIVGLGGLMLLVYDGVTDRWREHVIDPGAAVAVTYSAGNFTASGSMTWTVDSGDQVKFAYVQRGKFVQFFVVLTLTTVGGTLSNELRIALPNGFTAAYEQWSPFFGGYDSSVWVAVTASLQAGGTYLSIQKSGSGNYVAATNTTSLYFSGWTAEMN
jgi:hypothetical protein